MGITRLANVTCLDRVGVPVFQAVRPNARPLSVSSSAASWSTGTAPRFRPITSASLAAHARERGFATLPEFLGELAALSLAQPENRL
jgi:hypothetical protein